VAASRRTPQGPAHLCALCVKSCLFFFYRLLRTVKERAVYSYLLRHSLVVGKLRLQFAVMSLARILGLSIGAARQAVRRLDELGALRVLERSKTGHLAEMRLPEKIRAIRPGKNGASIAMGVGAIGVGTTGAAGRLLPRGSRPGIS
jgi:hypothetical protein